MIETLGELDIEAQTIDGLTGVWTAGQRPGGGADPEGEARKIGSIGVHISRGVTTHGLAINVNNDLQPFDWIVPCGIEGAQMTSIARELGAERELGGVMTILAHRYGEVFGRSPLDTAAAELARLVDGIEPLERAGKSPPLASARI